MIRSWNSGGLNLRRKAIKLSRSGTECPVNILKNSKLKFRFYFAVTFNDFYFFLRQFQKKPRLGQSVVSMK